jgi:hypothetical protein
VGVNAPNNSKPVVADEGFPPPGTTILADQYNIAPTLDGNVTLGNKKNVNSDIWNGDMNWDDSSLSVDVVLVLDTTTPVDDDDDDPV